MERPAFLEVPTPTGSITAVVANREGITEVEVNGKPHVGLLLSVNTASATIAICDPAEADRIAAKLMAMAQIIRGKRAAKGDL